MKVKIATNITSDKLDFLFYSERNGKRYIIKPLEKMEEKEWFEGDDIQPTISISHWASQETLKELVKVVEAIGVKSDSTEKIEGLLEATNYHLEDLRKMLGLNNKDIIISGQEE